MIRNYDVVVAGHICCDITPKFETQGKKKIDDLLVPGKLINMGDITISTGGPVSNTGIAMIKLGQSVQLMGKIGDDLLGGCVLNLLTDVNAADCMTVVPGERTSYTVAIVPVGYDRIFLHNPGANNTFNAQDIDYDAVKKAKLFHFGYPPLMRSVFENDGEELIKIFQKVKAMGVTTSLDMSLPDVNSASGQADWDGILKKLLPYVDLYLPSVEETMFMIDRASFDALNSGATGGDMLEHLDINQLQALGSRLLSYGAKIVVIKCGVKGLYACTADEETLYKMGVAKPGSCSNWAQRELHAESFHVEHVASATGSGDSAIAGFLSAFLRGCSIEETVKISCCVGGQNVQTLDALSGIKSWEETVSMIPAWDNNRLEVEGGYWHYDRSQRLWAGEGDKLHG